MPIFTAPLRAARGHAALIRWLLLLAALAVGCGCYATAAQAPIRAALSYAGGLLMVPLAFAFGGLNIRLAARVAPSLTLPMALLSYLITAVALGLVLAASSPRVVDGPAVAIGLLVSLPICVAGEIGRAWVVQEHP